MGKSGGARNEKNEKLLVEVAVEAEFKTFMEGLKKKFGGNQLAYRVSNYPEGLEFSFRIAKKAGTDGDKFTSSFSQKGMVKEKKELTEEQKKKLAEKRARKLEKQRLRKEKREKENQSHNRRRNLLRKELGSWRNRDSERRRERKKTNLLTLRKKRPTLNLKLKRRNLRKII